MGTINSQFGSSKKTKSGGERAAQKAAFSPLMEAFTRVGYGVRGLIYITIGLLAVDLILGKNSAPPDQQGAIAMIGKQPAGLILLWIVLIGLISYSLWGVIRAVFDPLHKGSDLKGLLARSEYLVSAISYGLLILPTYGYIRGTGGATSQGAQMQQSIASIIKMPWGEWIIGLTGIVVIVGGLRQIYEGLNASFDKQFKTYAMSAREVMWATQLGRWGTAARGLVFTLVGGSLCLAAYQANSRQVVGLDTALTGLLHQPYGVWLLGLVALGLISFGVYSVLTAIWFRLKR